MLFWLESKGFKDSSNYAVDEEQCILQIEKDFNLKDAFCRFSLQNVA